MNILKRDRSFNPENFYFYGGSLMRMDRNVFNDFKDSFKTLNWVKDPDGIYNSIPDDLRIPASMLPSDKTQAEKREIVNNHAIHNLPNNLKETIKDLLFSENFLSLSENYNFKINFVDLWNGSEGCVWHTDITDNADSLILAYFSDFSEKWTVEDGGHLEVGIRSKEKTSAFDLFSSNMEDNYNGIESIGIVPPVNRNVIMVNNKNPYFVHKCYKLSDNTKDRITLTLGIDFINKPDRNLKPEVHFGN